jgi:cytochrome c553
MKKKLIVLVAAFALIMALGIMFACTPTTNDGGGSDDTTNMAILDGLPTDLPDTAHIARMNAQISSGTECYTCHGNGDNGNPQDATARIVPEDHYLDKSYDSKAFDPARVACNTCHGGPVPVAAS